MKFSIIKRINECKYTVCLSLLWPWTAVLPCGVLDYIQNLHTMYSYMANPLPVIESSSVYARVPLNGNR